METQRGCQGHIDVGGLSTVKTELGHADTPGLPAGTLGLQRQPKNAEEAAQWITYLNAHHISVDVGLMQVSTDEAIRGHISSTALLDPCINVRTGW